MSIVIKTIHLVIDVFLYLVGSYCITDQLVVKTFGAVFELPGARGEATEKMCPICLWLCFRYFFINIIVWNYTYIRLFTTQVDIKKNKIQTDRQTDRHIDVQDRKIINLHKLHKKEGGRVEPSPPSYFLNPPNGVPYFVLGGGQYIQHTYDLHRSLERLPTAKKISTPQLFFHNSNPDLGYNLRYNVTIQRWVL